MQGECVWNVVEFRWGPPLKLDGAGRFSGELKSKQEWHKIDNEGSEVNVWALYNSYKSLQDSHV